MPCRGVHYGLTDEQYDGILSQPDDASRLDYLQLKIGRGGDARLRQETDKAWDAIHRCLTGAQNAPDGELDPTAGRYPLNQCILGGRSLYGEEGEHIIRLIEPQAVRDLSVALEPLDCRWMKRAYVRHCKDAWPEYGIEDGLYTWGWFEELRHFLTRMASLQRPVIFSVSL